MTEENFDDLEAQICAEMTADEEREALKERIAALERENRTLKESIGTFVVSDRHHQELLLRWWQRGQKPLM